MLTAEGIEAMVAAHHERTVARCAELELERRWTFPLWAFEIGPNALILFTRGRYQAEALEHVSRQPGVRVKPLDHLPLDAAAIYTRNHEPGWYYRPMYWLVALRDL